MQIKAIHEKIEIKEYLNTRDISNFVYHCNNLESPFWENTQWFGLYEDIELLAIAMLILKYDIPVLLATSYTEKDDHQEELLKKLSKYLPKNLYSHLNINTAKYLSSDVEDIKTTRYYNMKLFDVKKVNEFSSSIVKQLWEDDTKDIINLLEESHPDYIIDEEFINEGYFWGIKQDDKLVCIAGITAKSDDYKIVSIGCITTHPKYRRKGLATLVIARLIKFLAPNYTEIVLNVKQKNESALSCYRKLGFKEIGLFDETILLEK